MEDKMQQEINLRMDDPYWNKRIAHHVSLKVKKEKEARENLFRFFIPASVLSAVLIAFLIHFPQGNNVDNQDSSIVKTNNPYEVMINHQIVGTWHAANGNQNTSYNQKEESFSTVSSVMSSDIDQWMENTLYASYER